MSQAHAQKFYEMVLKDQALFDKLTAGNKSQYDFISKVVAEARQHGLEISPDEANEFMKNNLARAMPAGELSDQQLEAVAGGKITATGSSLTIDISKCTTGGGGDFAAQFFGAFVGWSWAWNT